MYGARNAKLKDESKIDHASQLQVTRYHWVEHVERVNLAYILDAAFFS